MIQTIRPTCAFCRWEIQRKDFAGLAYLWQCVECKAYCHRDANDHQIVVLDNGVPVLRSYKELAQAS